MAVVLPFADHPGRPPMVAHARQPQQPNKARPPGQLHRLPGAWLLKILLARFDGHGQPVLFGRNRAARELEMYNKYNSVKAVKTLIKLAAVMLTSPAIVVVASSLYPDHPITKVTVSPATLILAEGCPGMHACRASPPTSMRAIVTP
jgi:hypothetical protein